MPIERIAIILVCLIALALFGFQLWFVLRTGHVRWRVQKIRRSHRPVAFAVEVSACVLGLLLFGALLVWTLIRTIAAAG
jgi:hypothetical protein